MAIAEERGLQVLPVEEQARPARAVHQSGRRLTVRVEHAIGVERAIGRGGGAAGHKERVALVQPLVARQRKRARGAAVGLGERAGDRRGGSDQLGVVAGDQQVELTADEVTKP
jgi:hypothetical protein